MDPRIFLFALATFVTGTAENIIVGLVLDVAGSLDVSVALAGQLTAIFSISFALTAPWAPLLAARLERRRLYLGALALFVAGNALAACSQVYAVLFAARILMAGASALVCVLATTLATEQVAPELRGRAIGIIFMGISGSLVLGVPAGMLLSQWSGWRGVFWALAAVAALVLLSSILFVPRARPSDAPRLYYRCHLANGRLVAAQGVSVLMIAGHFVLFAYLLPYLVHAADLDAADAAYAFVTFGAAGGYLGGRIADRLLAGKALVLVPAAYLLVLLILPWLLSRFAWAAAPVVMIWSCISWMISPVVQGFLLRMDAPTAQAGISLNFSAMHVGVGLGTFVDGLTLDRLSVAYLPAVAAVLAAGAVCLAVGAACPGSRSG